MATIGSRSIGPDYGPHVPDVLPQSLLLSMASNSKPRHQGCDHGSTIFVIDDDEEVLNSVGDAIMRLTYLLTAAPSFTLTIKRDRVAYWSMQLCLE